MSISSLLNSIQQQTFTILNKKGKINQHESSMYGLKTILSSVTIVIVTLNILVDKMKPKYMTSQVGYLKYCHILYLKKRSNFYTIIGIKK